MVSPDSSVLLPFPPLLPRRLSLPAYWPLTVRHNLQEVIEINLSFIKKLKSILVSYIFPVFEFVVEDMNRQKKAEKTLMLWPLFEDMWSNISTFVISYRPSMITAPFCSDTDLSDVLCSRKQSSTEQRRLNLTWIFKRSLAVWRRVKASQARHVSYSKVSEMGRQHLFHCHGKKWACWYSTPF